MNPNEHAEAFREWINSDRAFTDHRKPVDNFPMLDSKRGAMIGHLEQLCGGERERRTFLKYVFNVESSADLHCRQQNALYLWLAPRKDDLAGQWGIGNAKAPATVAAVLRAALVAAGQMEFDV